LIGVVSVVLLGFQPQMVYYPHMPSIVGKRRGKHTYYYLVESARVDGQPRIVSQQYLGTAEEVLARLGGAATGEPARSQHTQFGDLAAVWSMRSCLTHSRSVSRLTPSSLAIWVTVLSLERTKATASRRNSAG